MKKRFFAFGCSYTKSWSPTWADYIGINFDEYVNLGRGGSSNTFAMNRLTEVNEKYGLNPETDHVMVMLTGFSRYSWMADSEEKKGWQTIGDMYSNYQTTKEKKLGAFLDDMWSEKWAVYQSWIAAKSIKDLLVRNNISHEILMGIDNSCYLTEVQDAWWGTTTLNRDTVKLAEEIYDMVSYRESLDEWKDKKYKREEHVFWKDRNCYDGHPTAKMHFEYVREKFPEFITEKSQALLDYAESIADYSSQAIHGRKFHEYHMTFNRDGQFPLFE